MKIGGMGYLNQINRTNHAASRTMQQLASASRYPSASYGPSAYAISRRMYSNIGAINQSNENTQNANAMLSTAAGGVSSTVSALSSLRDQILQAANGTNSDSDIATISNSVNQTIQTINENAGIEYNGMPLLNGTQSATVGGVNGYQNIQLGNMSSQALGLTDQNGNSTLDLTSNSGIASALNAVDNALNQALNESANIGAAQQNLSFSSANYTTQEEYLTGANSTMSDADMAKMITQMNSEKVQNQLALHAQKMFMHNSAAVLSLLH